MGTSRGHRVSVARALAIEGPYDTYDGNPSLTLANTTGYIQAVGHADLFQDASKNWWSSALGIRWTIDSSSPLGRETFLTPVMWNDGEYPVFANVTGEMSGWAFPGEVDHLEDNAASNISSDVIKFNKEAGLPSKLVHWRFPVPENYEISPSNYGNSVRLTSSQTNLTGLAGSAQQAENLAFVGGRQTHSFFSFHVDIANIPTKRDQEVGVTAFLDLVLLLLSSLLTEN